MASDTAGEAAGGGREGLLRAVRGRLDGLGGPDGTAPLHTEEARAETDALLHHLVGTGPDGSHGVDQEVAYTLGVALLIRADDRRTAPAAEQDARRAVLLLGPFHFHLPDAPDVLPPQVRAAVEALLGPGGKRPEEPEAMVQEHAASLANLALLLMEPAVGLLRPEVLETAADLTRGAMPYLSPEGTDRALAGCNLGYALLLRCVHGDAGPERLTEAVSVLRTALAGTPPDHPGRVRAANGLGLSLIAQAVAAEDRTLLPEAIELLRTAARDIDPADDNTAQIQSDLGQALTLYAVSAGEGEEVGPEVREEAVAVLRRSVARTPAGDRETLRARLGRLADATLIGVARTDRTRAAAQAAQTVEVVRRLLGLTPPEHPEHADVVLRLAAALVTAEQPQDAIDLLRGADPVLEGDAERTRRAEALLFQAAVLKGELASRSRRSPEERDRSAVMDAFLHPVEGDDHPLAVVRRLLGLGPRSGEDGSRREERDFTDLVLDYPEKASLHELLAAALAERGRSFARLPEEERAQAVAEYLEQGPAEPEPVFQRQVDTSALDELLDVHDRLLSRLAPDSREYRMVQRARSMLSVTKIMYGPSGESGDDLDLDRRMRESKQLLEGLLEDVPQMMGEAGLAPELLGGLATLPFAHESPFDQVEAVEEGIRAARRGMTELTEGTREYDEARGVLAVWLFTRYTLWSQEADFAEAEDLARELTAVPRPDVWTAQLLWLWSGAVRGRIQDARMVRDAPSPAGRSPQPLTRVSSELAAMCLDDRNPAEALESLEEGRARMLSSALNARGELAALQGADAEMHARLRAALDRVRNVRRAAVPGRRPTEEEIARQRSASADAARLIGDLQRRPGFKRFLTPLRLSLDDLLPAAAQGPVVSVNVHPRRCDALALCPDGLRAVRLPRLSAADLMDQAESFRTATEVLTAGPRDPLFEEAREVFTGTLAWLWDVLAEPVLDALGFTAPPEPGAPWPRLWWSPSGVLNSFPLHAAGHHGPGSPEGAAVLDRVVSSYTPTLRALLFSRARRRADAGRRGVLAVAMPETAGQAPLARTVAEATAVVAAGGGTPLIGPAATREAVRAAVPAAAVVHFACHADSAPEDPAAGRLLLADGDLPIRDIAELRLDSAELAYLSACGTARTSAVTAEADEVIHLASAFQLAGYTQSVATLWEVGDAFAADAAAAFHTELGPALPDPGPLPAALALHHTVRALRAAAPDRPWTWSALVHAGA